MLGLGLHLGPLSHQWSPRSLAPLAWYRADSLTSSPVSTWVDLTGNGHDLTQGTALLRPTWTASDANYGGQAVVSAPAGEWMAVDMGADYAQPNTILLVGRVNNRLVDGSTLDGKRNTVMASGGFICLFAGSAVVASTQASGVRQNVEGFFSGASSEVRIAGGADILPGNPGVAALRSVGIFATANGVGTGTGDELAELVVLPRALTADERAVWAAYTLARYGL